MSSRSARRARRDGARPVDLPRPTRAPEFHDVHLPDGVLGDCDPVAGVIRIDPEQTSAEYRCTLEHEWEHWLRGDVPCGDWARDARMERAVHRSVAIRLVPLDALMDALAWCHSLDEAADELHVDRETLDARIACLDQEDRDVVDERMREQQRGIA